VTLSNVVIASSRILARDLEERTGRRVHHLPHGVDFQFFRDRVAASASPEDLERIPRPRIGYVARLDERIDHEALIAIALARPGWSVVLVGGVGFQSNEGHSRFEALTSLPNVYALGQKPRDEIPAYTAALDVCLLCYRNDNWGRYVQPIKAYEYLACGRPVVSSPIDAVRDFGSLIAVAEDLAGWVPAIEAALRDRSEESFERRIDFARRNTWDVRAAELVQLLERELSGQAVPGTR
jgi:glycosyltransferase involved in cell wall biosynthesis